MVMPPVDNGHVIGFDVLIHPQLSQKNTNIIQEMDVGQNGRPRGPQMLV